MLALLLVTFGVFAGGWIRFNFLPPIEADNTAAFLTMPQGTPAEVTAEMMRADRNGGAGARPRARRGGWARRRSATS